MWKLWWTYNAPHDQMTHRHTAMLLGVTPARPPYGDLLSRDCICLIIPPVADPLLCFLLFCVWLCVAMLSSGALASEPLSAFSCSEGNQLWQSCKLFLLGAKGAGAHAHSRPPCLYQGPVGSYGPFIRQAWKAPAISMARSTKKEVVRLFGCAGEE